MYSDVFAINIKSGLIFNQKYMVTGAFGITQNKNLLYGIGFYNIF
jgi:hypothetical protein